MSQAALRSESSNLGHSIHVEAPWDDASRSLEAQDDGVSGFHVFPFGVARLSGLPIATLDAFGFKESLAQRTVAQRRVIEQVVEVEEMLPRRDALAEHGSRTHVTELVLQLDRDAHA